MTNLDTHNDTRPSYHTHKTATSMPQDPVQARLAGMLIFFLQKERIVHQGLLALLFIADLLSAIRREGKTISGETYLKVETGPIPQCAEDVINHMLRNKIVREEPIIRSFDVIYAFSLIKKDIAKHHDIFNDEEMVILNQVYTTLISKNETWLAARAQSHPLWRKTSWFSPIDINKIKEFKEEMNQWIEQLQLKPQVKDN